MPTVPNYGQIGQSVRGLVGKVADVYFDKRQKLYNAEAQHQLSNAVFDMRTQYDAFLLDLEKDNDFNNYDKKWDAYQKEVYGAVSEAIQIPEAKQAFEGTYLGETQKYTSNILERQYTKQVEVMFADWSVSRQAILDKAVPQSHDQLKDLYAYGVANGLIDAGKAPAALSADMEVLDAAIENTMANRIEDTARRMGYDEGIAWILEQGDRLEVNDDKRREIIQNLRYEKGVVEQQEDENLDSRFSDNYLKVNSVKTAEDLLDDVIKRGAGFHDPARTVYWKDKAMREVKYQKDYAALPDEGDKAHKEFQKRYADNMLAEIYFAEGEVSKGEIRKAIEEAYEKGWITGTDVEKFYKLTEAEDDPVFDTGIKYINKFGLEPDEWRRATLEYTEWYRNHPDATPAEVNKAVENIVNRPVLENLSRKSKEAWDAILGTERVLTKHEKLMLEIEAGRFVGLTEQEGYVQQLAANAGIVLEAAKKLYPNEDIITSFADTHSLYGYPAGTAILASGEKEDGRIDLYLFKMEGKQAVLYQIEKEKGIDVHTGMYPIRRLKSTKELAEDKKTAEKILKKEEKVIEEQVEREAAIFVPATKGREVNLKAAIEETKQTTPDKESLRKQIKAAGLTKPLEERFIFMLDMGRLDELRKLLEEILKEHKELVK